MVIWNSKWIREHERGPGTRGGEILTQSEARASGQKQLLEAPSTRTCLSPNPGGCEFTFSSCPGMSRRTREPCGEAPDATAREQAVAGRTPLEAAATCRSGPHCRGEPGHERVKYIAHSLSVISACAENYLWIKAERTLSDGLHCAYLSLTVNTDFVSPTAQPDVKYQEKKQKNQMTHQSSTKHLTSWNCSENRVI